MSRTLTASDRTALIRLASTLPAGSAERKAILASLLSIRVEKEAAMDKGLRKALAAWKADLMWENQARREGKTVLIQKTGWRSGTPEFSKLVREINAKFFAGSGYHIEVTGPVKDVREAPKRSYGEENYSYQEYVILPAGSPERKAILAGLSKVSRSSEGSGTARRPISVKGKKFTDWEYKIDSKSIYITLYNDAEDMVWAVREEYFPNKEWFIAAVTQVAENLKSGDLPEGFEEQDFHKG